MAPLKVCPTVPPAHTCAEANSKLAGAIPVYLSVDLRNMRTCVSKSSVRLFSRVIGTIMGPTAAHTVKQPVLQKGVLIACGRGTRFEAQKSSAHLLKPTKTPNSLWPREELSLRHPASWVASHQGAGPDLCQPATIFSERRPQEKVSHAQQRRAHGFQRTVKRNAFRE